MKGEIKYLDYKTAIGFLLPRHYSGRKPVISLAFGWYINKELVAVCSFGKPANYKLCEGICGKDYAKDVYELNRLCRVDELSEQLSQFVSACLRYISNTEKWIVVSYSDTSMSHNGYVYQACNFIFTGQTKERLDFTGKNGHGRHGSMDTGFRKVRSAKNRYVYFAGKKRDIQKWKSAFNYPNLPYPKGDNKNYILGEFQQPIIVEYTN